MANEKISRELGTVVHMLDVDKATSFIKKKLDAPDVPFVADPMVIVNGEKGLATVINQGVGWYVDKDGFLPINYSGPADLSGYLDISLAELAYLISDETVDISEFIKSLTERHETNFFLWKYYARGFPQSKEQLIAKVNIPFTSEEGLIEQ